MRCFVIAFRQKQVQKGVVSRAKPDMLMVRVFKAPIVLIGQANDMMCFRDCLKPLANKANISARRPKITSRCFYPLILPILSLAQNLSKGAF